MVMFSTLYIEGPTLLKLMGMERAKLLNAMSIEPNQVLSYYLAWIYIGVTPALVFIRYVVLMGPGGSVGLK